jgi:hypothetical protein
MVRTNKYIQKPFEMLEIRFIRLFGQLPFLIRIRIPNTDPDPGEPNQCGSLQIRIQNSAPAKDEWIHTQ